MMRAHSLLVSLIVVLIAVAACKSTEKSDEPQTTHRLKAGDKVPPEIARTIDGKIVYEGRNEIDWFPTGRVFAVVKNGQLDSLILEEDGEEPVVMMMGVTSPAPGPSGETPQGCDQRYDNCVRGCGGAADRQCCLYKCFFEWRKCVIGAGGSGSRGITMF